MNCRTLAGLIALVFASAVGSLHRVNVARAEGAALPTIDLATREGVALVPGGLWVLSPGGEHLGTIVTPRHAHNMAWGDDGQTLYLCARDRLYRMRLNPGRRS